MVTESTDFNQLVEKEEWLSSTKLVVKPDMLLGKRGKSGLIVLNLDLAGVAAFIKERLGKEVENWDKQSVLPRSSRTGRLERRFDMVFPDSRRVHEQCSPMDSGEGLISFGFRAKEAVAWELFTPIQRVLTVAVVAAAAADNSKKIKQISRLQNSVELRDQVLLGMQQKLDNLHEQVNYFKDQPEVRTQTDVFLTKRLECGLNAEEVAKCEVEPDECRMSDLSDWAPSVISSVDIQEDWDGICGHVFGALACEVEALGLFCRMNNILIKMML
ncbi:hypothetical protein OROGR_015294 [Orobanche gracilis]